MYKFYNKITIVNVDHAGRFLDVTPTVDESHSSSHDSQWAGSFLRLNSKRQFHFQTTDWCNFNSDKG